MRISADKNDSGYSPLVFSAIAKVTLNGEYVAHCVTADDKLNLVTFYLEDDQGRIVVDNGEAVLMEATGVVRIFLNPGYAPYQFAGIQ